MWFNILNQIGEKYDTYIFFYKSILALVLGVGVYLLLSRGPVKQMSTMRLRRFLYNVFGYGVLVGIILALVYIVTVPKTLVDQFFFAVGEFSREVLKEVDIDGVTVYMDESSIRFEYKGLLPLVSAYKIGGFGKQSLVYFILSGYDKTTSSDILSALGPKLPEARPLEILVLGLNQQEIFSGAIRVTKKLETAKIRVKVQPLRFSRLPGRWKFPYVVEYTRQDLERLVAMLLNAQTRKPVADRVYMTYWLLSTFGAVLGTILIFLAMWGTYWVIFKILRTFVAEELVEYPRELAFLSALILAVGVQLLPFDMISLFFLVPFFTVGIMHLKSHKFIE